MVVTSRRLIKIFVAPPLIASWTALRSATSPTPIVVLPLGARIVTPSPCRTFTFIACLSYSRLAFAFDLGDPLAQRHHGAAARAHTVLDVIHETLHVEDPPAVRLEQVFRRQRVLQVGGIEADPFVLDADDYAVALEGQIDLHFLGRILLVAVLDGVRHRLTDRDVDPVPIVLVQPEP